MKLQISFDNDPGIQKLLLASFVLHMLFFALIATPYKTSPKVDPPYFVNLVTPESKPEQPKPVPPAAPKKVKKSRAALVQKKKSLQVVKPAESRKKTIARAAVKKERAQTPPEATERTAPLPPITRPSIARTAAKPAISLPVPGRRGNRLDTPDPRSPAQQGQTALIARKNRSGIPRSNPVEKPSRDTATESPAGIERARSGIERTGRSAETVGEEIPVKRRYDSVSADPRLEKENVIIARNSAASESKGALEPEEEVTVDIPSSRIPEHSVSTDTGEMAAAEAGAITKAGSTGNDPLDSPSYELPDHEGIIRSGFKGTIDSSDKKTGVHTAISISGVPLDDLIACAHARDERNLKKKILKIVDNRKQCSDPETGNYLFKGAVRITSFDMVIQPTQGRNLSDRCKELENAYRCLRLTE